MQAIGAARRAALGVGRRKMKNSHPRIIAAMRRDDRDHAVMTEACVMLRMLTSHTLITGEAPGR